MLAPRGQDDSICDSVILAQALRARPDFFEGTVATMKADNVQGVIIESGHWVAAGGPGSVPGPVPRRIGCGTVNMR
jgi:hypothetical protein